MKYIDRVNAIAARLQGLPRAGKVHNHRRFSGNWSKYLQHFKNDDGIYGWTASRRAGARGESSTRWAEEYQLTRVCGVRDTDAGPSEVSFQEDLDLAVADFRDNPGFGFGEVLDGELELEAVYDSEVGGVLCHVAVCVMKVSFHYDELGEGA